MKKLILPIFIVVSILIIGFCYFYQFKPIELNQQEITEIQSVIKDKSLNIPNGKFVIVHLFYDKDNNLIENKVGFQHGLNIIKLQDLANEKVWDENYQPKDHQLYLIKNKDFNITTDSGLNSIYLLKKNYLK